MDTNTNTNTNNIYIVAMQNTPPNHLIQSIQDPNSSNMCATSIVTHVVFGGLEIKKSCVKVHDN